MKLLGGSGPHEGNIFVNGLPVCDDLHSKENALVYSRRNRELDNSRRDENSNSRRDENSNTRRNRELSNPLLRRDLLFSFLFLCWIFGELAIIVEFSNENY